MLTTPTLGGHGKLLQSLFYYPFVPSTTWGRGEEEGRGRGEEGGRTYTEGHKTRRGVGQDEGRNLLGFLQTLQISNLFFPEERFRDYLHSLNI